VHAGESPRDERASLDRGSQEASVLNIVHVSLQTPFPASSVPQEVDPHVVLIVEQMQW
jgi:hypothetical protein